MNIRNFTFVLLSAALAFAACNKPHPGYEETESGIFYKFHEEAEEGLKPDSGDYLSFYLRWYTEDTIYYDSKDAGGEINLVMKKPATSMDVFALLQKMKTGDSATFIVQPDTFFGGGANLVPDTIEELFVDLKLLEIMPKDEFQKEQARKHREKRAEENRNIMAYLDENVSETDTTESGIYIIRHRKTGGKKIESGKVVMLSFKGSLLNGDVFQEMTPGFAYIPGEAPDYPFKWDPVLKQMSSGDEATILLPSSQALGERGMEGMIPPYSPLVLEIKIHDVLSKEDFQEKQLANEGKKRSEADRSMKDYLRTNRITQQPTESGLIYITVDEGTGPSPETGDTAMVHYKGYLLDGKVFDSSYDRGEPIQVVIGQGGLIEGWLEAIPMMKEGEKAKIIVPWNLAYGKRQTGPIPAYANLVFELELVEIK